MATFRVVPRRLARTQTREGWYVERIAAHGQTEIVSTRLSKTEAEKEAARLNAEDPDLNG
jgi:hypothetical protein